MPLDARILHGKMRYFGHVLQNKGASLKVT